MNFILSFVLLTFSGVVSGSHGPGVSQHHASPRGYGLNSDGDMQWCNSKDHTCVLRNPGRTAAEKRDAAKYQCHERFPVSGLTAHQ